MHAVSLYCWCYYHFRHLELLPTDLELLNDPIESILSTHKFLRAINVACGTGEERQLDIELEFQALTTQINGLKKFPLRINKIHGVDSIFRSAQV